MCVLCVKLLNCNKITDVDWWDVNWLGRWVHWPSTLRFSLPFFWSLCQNWLLVVILLIFLIQFVSHNGQLLLLQNNNFKVNFAPLRTQFLLCLLFFSIQKFNFNCNTLSYCSSWILLTSHFGCLLFPVFDIWFLFIFLFFCPSPPISFPNCPPLLPGPGVLFPVPHPPSLQRLWQACRSSAPPCAVTVWAPEIVTHAPPPLSDTTSSPIAKVRAPLHSLLPPALQGNTSSPLSPGMPPPLIVLSVIMDPLLHSGSFLIWSYPCLSPTHAAKALIPY